MRKQGFTLAEVLIALGIIGVIAALTMPSLTKLNVEAGTGALLASTRATVEEAASRVIMDNPTQDITNANFNFEGKLGEHLLRFGENGALKNGAVVSFANSTKGGFKDITVDINGPDNKPNSYGVDQFEFVLSKHGVVVPWGCAKIIQENGWKVPNDYDISTCKELENSIPGVTTTGGSGGATSGENCPFAVGDDCYNSLDDLMKAEGIEKKEYCLPPLYYDSSTGSCLTEAPNCEGLTGVELEKCQCLKASKCWVDDTCVTCESGPCAGKTGTEKLKCECDQKSGWSWNGTSCVQDCTGCNDTEGFDRECVDGECVIVACTNGYTPTWKSKTDNTIIDCVKKEDEDPCADLTGLEKEECECSDDEFTIVNGEGVCGHICTQKEMSQQGVQTQCVMDWVKCDNGIYASDISQCSDPCENSCWEGENSSSCQSCRCQYSGGTYIPGVKEPGGSYTKGSCSYGSSSSAGGASGGTNSKDTEMEEMKPMDGEQEAGMWTDSYDPDDYYINPQ